MGGSGKGPQMPEPSNKTIPSQTAFPPSLHPATPGALWQIGYLWGP